MDAALPSDLVTDVPVALPLAPGGARPGHRGNFLASNGLSPLSTSAHPPADRRNPSIGVILRAALQRNGSQRFPQA
jgi:hypothetical protein